jgi:hypothetical protein
MVQGRINWEALWRPQKSRLARGIKSTNKLV